MALAKQRSAWFFAASVLALLCLPALAFAADTSTFFEPVVDDKSLMILNAVFAGLFNSYMQTQAVPHEGFEAAILALNAGALTIAGIFVAYTLGVGTIQTAHDGSTFGKGWSKMWLPIRAALGTALLVPVQSYCAAQMLVAWLLVQGIGIADNLWIAYVSETEIAGSAYDPFVVPQNVKHVAEIAFANELCVKANNDILAEDVAQGGGNVGDSLKMAPGWGYIAPGANTGELRSLGNSAVAHGRWGQPEGSSDLKEGVDTGACGRVVFDVTRSARQADKDAAIARGTPDPTSDTIASKLVADLETLHFTEEQIEAAHIAAFDSMQEGLKDLAERVVDSTKTTGPGAWGQIFDELLPVYVVDFKAALLGTAGTANLTNSLKASMVRDGWIMAGSWFMRPMFLQDSINRAASLTPVVLPPNLMALGDNQPRVKNVIDMGMSWLITAKKGDAFNVTATGMAGDALTGFNSKGGEQHAKYFGWMRAQLNILAFQFQKLQEGIETRHPVMALKDFGDSLIVLATDMILHHPQKGENLKGAQSVGGNLAGQVHSTILSLAIMLGTIFAVYIPLLPFVLFSATAIGWLILAVETILAAPLWAAMKLAPEGDDVMGASKNGYKMILGVIFRPALIVMGMCAALMVVEPVVRFLNSIFFQSVQASLGSGGGLLVLVAVMGFYFGVLQTLITKIFSMIHELPDKLPKWMNVQGPSLGGFAQEAEQALQGGAAKAESGVGVASRFNQGLIANDKGELVYAGSFDRDAYGRLVSDKGSSSDDQSIPDSPGYASQARRDDLIAERDYFRATDFGTLDASKLSDEDRAKLASQMGDNDFYKRDQFYERYGVSSSEAFLQLGKLDQQDLVRSLDDTRAELSRTAAAYLNAVARKDPNVEVVGFSRNATQEDAWDIFLRNPRSPEDTLISVSTASNQIEHYDADTAAKMVWSHQLLEQAETMRNEAESAAISAEAKVSEQMRVAADNAAESQRIAEGQAALGAAPAPQQEAGQAKSQ